MIRWCDNTRYKHITQQQYSSSKYPRNSYHRYLVPVVRIVLLLYYKIQYDSIIPGTSAVVAFPKVIWVLGAKKINIATDIEWRWCTRVAVPSILLNVCCDVVTIILTVVLLPATCYERVKYSFFPRRPSARHSNAWFYSDTCTERERDKTEPDRGKQRNKYYYTHHAKRMGNLYTELPFPFFTFAAPNNTALFDCSVFGVRWVMATSLRTYVAESRERFRQDQSTKYNQGGTISSSRVYGKQRPVLAAYTPVSYLKSVYCSW